MERKKPPAPRREDEHLSGWAHFERAAEHELRFAEWCPDRWGPHGQCGTDLVHGWRSSGAARARLSERTGKRKRRV